MSEFSRLTGMPQAVPNANTKDVRFVLSVSEGAPIMCVANYGVAAQIASGLGSAIRVLRMALASDGTMEPIAAEEIREIHVQKDQWSDVVLVQLTTVLAIPYTFQISSQMAAEIADRLKTESEKPTQTGHA